jgi:hypothetical protein
MVPKADGSANHFDTQILFEHVTEESGPRVQSLRMPPVVLVQDRSEPKRQSGTASKEQVSSCAHLWLTLPGALALTENRPGSSVKGQNA